MNSVCFCLLYDLHFFPESWRWAKIILLIFTQILRRLRSRVNQLVNPKTRRPLSALSMRVQERRSECFRLKLHCRSSIARKLWFPLTMSDDSPRSSLIYWYCPIEGRTGVRIARWSTIIVQWLYNEDYKCRNRQQIFNKLARLLRKLIN